MSDCLEISQPAMANSPDRENGNFTFNFKLPDNGLSLHSVRIGAGNTPEFYFSASRNVPTLTEEDVAVAFRLVSEKRRPEFFYLSFPPMHPLHDSRFYKYYSPTWMKGTQMGETLSEADWSMKCMSLGTRTDEEKTAFKSWSQSSKLKGLANKSDFPADAVSSSMIMSCDHVRMRKTNNEIMFPEEPKMKIETGTSLLYSKYITEKFDSVAFHDEPRFRRIQEQVKLVVAVEWLYLEKNVRVSQEWVTSHTTKLTGAQLMLCPPRKEPPVKMVPLPPAFKQPSSDVRSWEVELYKAFSEQGETRYGYKTSSSMVTFQDDGTPCVPVDYLMWKFHFKSSDLPIEMRNQLSLPANISPAKFKEELFKLLRSSDQKRALPESSSSKSSISAESAESSSVSFSMSASSDKSPSSAQLPSSADLSSAIRKDGEITSEAEENSMTTTAVESTIILEEDSDQSGMELKVTLDDNSDESGMELKMTTTAKELHPSHQQSSAPHEGTMIVTTKGGATSYLNEDPNEVLEAMMVRYRCEDATQRVKSWEELISEYTVPIPCKWRGVPSEGIGLPAACGGVSTQDFKFREEPFKQTTTHRETQWKDNFTKKGSLLGVRAETQGSIQLVDSRSGDYHTVSSKFKSKWSAQKGTPPSIGSVFAITNSNLLQKWQSYRQSLGRQYHTSTEHFHGTSLTCNIMASNTLCSDRNCGICGIACSGFQSEYIGRKINFQRFGKGYYLAPNSSKCHDYTQGANGCRAMLLCDVLPGRTFKSTTNGTDWTSPPPGYHSVSGQKGEKLNYPEIVVYTPDAVMPRYIITYWKDGIEHPLSK